MKSKILITGGSGFIGSHLIQFLLRTYPKLSIVNLDLEPSKIQSANLESHQLDIRSFEYDLKFLVGEKFICCIHLAALCKEPGYPWEHYFVTNYQGTKNVLSICDYLEINKVIFTSTMMVYKAGESKRTERSITDPDTAYGISKLLAEKELNIWKAKVNGRKIKIIRPAVVFGENENANFTRLYKSLKKGFFPFIGRKTTIKSNIYVKELVRFIDFQMENDSVNDIFNFSFPVKHEMQLIIQAFKKVFGFNSFTPVLPYNLMLLVSYFFEFIDGIGIKNSIHHRRIQKLYNSTFIYPEAAIKENYNFHYTLESSLKDWKDSEDLNL